MTHVFEHADLVLSVSRFNTGQLLEAFPGCRGRVAYVPNAADDLFFEPAPPHERARVRDDLGLPPGMPYLLSVANFQPRKNLVRLVKAASRLPEVSGGELALVIVGSGAEEEAGPLREAAVAAGRRALIRMPGYRQGRALRAAYAEAAAMVFPSLCESFGIPAVEAMAQGIPVALADSTALPEIGGEAGWYFDPTSEDAIANTIRRLLDDPGERDRRVMLDGSSPATTGGRRPTTCWSMRWSPVTAGQTEIPSTPLEAHPVARNPRSTPAVCSSPDRWPRRWPAR